MVFFESGLDCLKIIATGELTNYHYVLRVDSSKTGSHFTYGQFIKIGEQLFPMFLPKLSDNKFLLIRQDSTDRNRIDVNIVFSDFKQIKPENIHHQSENNSEFYYQEIVYDNNIIQIAIDSKGYDELMKNFRMRFLGY